MEDEPPPLPPKQRNRYSEEDQARALEEEKLAFERLHKEKLERSQSQRLTNSQRENVITSHQRSHTPTDNKSQFYDVNYISKTIARPVPKPRSISLIKDDVQTNVSASSDSNSNFPKKENKNDDLMSFVSPEKPNNGFNDMLQKLQDLNKNSNAFRSGNQYNSYHRPTISSSHSMPLGINTMFNNSSVATNMGMWNKGNLSNGSYSSFSSNSPQLHNMQFPFQQQSQIPFTLSPNIPLGPDHSITPPPLPNRSPVMDMSRLSIGIYQGPTPVTSSTATVSSTAPFQSNAMKQTFSIKENKKPSDSCSVTSTSSTPPAIPLPTKTIERISKQSFNKQVSKDLIDLGGFKDSSKHSKKENSFSSVLDAFDPLMAKSGPDVIDIPMNSNHDVPISDEARELLNLKASRKIKEDEQSYYEQVDPFQYMQPSGASTRSDPVLDIYDGLVSPGVVGGETFDIPPPLPPRFTQKEESPVKFSLKGSKIKEEKTLESVYKGETTSSTHIHLKKTESLNADKEARAFWTQIKKLRSEYAYEDHIGNPGLLHSPCLESSYTLNLSVKLAVFYRDLDPVLFTCNLNTGVEHVVMQSMVALELSGECSDYLLKVRGIDEYLCDDTQLGEYEYVHLCIKYDSDILFTLVNVDEAKKSYLRTAEDDAAIDMTEVRHLLIVGSIDAAYFDSLAIAVETFESESSKLQKSGFQLMEGTPNHELSSPMRSRQLRQVVKQICALLGELETVCVSKAIEYLIETCRTIQKSQVIERAQTVSSNEMDVSNPSLDPPQNSDENVRVEDPHGRIGIQIPIDMSGRLFQRPLTLFRKFNKIIKFSKGVLDGEDEIPGQAGFLLTGSHDSSQPSDELKSKLEEALSRLGAEINHFLFMYMGAFRVDFTVEMKKERSDETMDISTVRDRIEVDICGLHRLDKEWHFDEFFVEVQVFHGSSCVGKPHYTSLQTVISDPKFYPKINFSQKVDMEARINTLPRESRMVFTVFGVKKLVPENKDTGTESRFIREELGWAAIQMFSFDGYLASGGFLLTLWPMASDKRLGPAPWSSDHPFAHSCPILSVELQDFGAHVFFPVVEPLPPNKLNFEDLDLNTQQQLQDIIERDIFTFNKSSIEEREILWEKRHYLHEAPDAFAKVLLAAHSWDVACLSDLHSLTLNWTSIPPADALHLLLPSFPDTVVRNKAVEWIRGLGSDELTAYLPQLVQAVKHEAFDVSKLTELLLERALTSPRLAHHLYWLLNQCLPLQTSMGGEREVLADARYTRRLNMVTRALMKICGKNLESRLLRQEAVLRTLYETALAIKDTKDSQRMLILHHELRTIHENLKDSPTSLPLSPSLEVAGVDIEACSYYTSFTVPLKLSFISSEPNTQLIHTIFKVGDDLRQDMLVIQMIRLMDKLWLKEGLDLKIVTFNVVPTGDKIGILEMVRDAETLRKIQTENGLTGSFKERPIAEWLAKQNPSQLEYHRAVANFTASCAGYCVATYILGVCDRHNDNIMLKTSGHLFHIDFGKFLGDAQKFGNVKRDRTPFVLTTDMAYVINGGEKPSDKFQAFVDLCCKAFNIIRQNAHLLLYLFALMASSGIPGVTSNAVHYVEKALLQDKTNAEAGAFFAKMIQESLKNWFTQVNFFIHNLAQMRFSGDSTETDSLLSFVPHTYTMAQDGRIKKVRLYSFQKRYNPFKYYVYILKVEREGQLEPSFLFRSYKEFSEFHQKLCYVFPLAKINSLPKGVQIGRSEVKAVAEKRKLDIELFIASLFSLADEIAHSDLVYTFLHPLLRDQEDTDIHIRKLKIKDNRSSTSNINAVASGSFQVQGQVKVSLQYIRGQLQIVVQHARNLAQASGSPEPSPYVKLYLLPDPAKKTKRKTKVVKKTCHPTFMEMITYRMNLDVIRKKVLEISVWSEDKFSENSYLGSAYLRLEDLNWKEETCEWLSLEHHIRTAREHMLPLRS